MYSYSCILKPSGIWHYLFYYDLIMEFVKDMK